MAALLTLLVSLPQAAAGHRERRMPVDHAADDDSGG